MNMWRAVATQGTQLKREQLYREIARVSDPVLRSNLEHTYSKLFMFLEEDLGRALRIAGRQPYPTG
jgi:DNA-binding phage protein